MKTWGYPHTYKNAEDKMVGLRTAHGCEEGFSRDSSEKAEDRLRTREKDSVEEDKQSRHPCCGGQWALMLVQALWHAVSK